MQSSVCDWRPNLDAYEPSLQKAADLAAAFVADMACGKTPGRWLTFTGKTGCGKTMLARQILEQSGKSNPGRDTWGPFPGPYLPPRPYCVWLDATQFADSMRSGHYHLPESLANDWCVVLDDIGTVRDRTDFVAEAIYRFCNARMGKWTVFTSNLSLEQIMDQIDERVASRLIRDNNTMHRITARDYALEQMRRKEAKSA